MAINVVLAIQKPQISVALNTGAKPMATVSISPTMPGPKGDQGPQGPQGEPGDSPETMASKLYVQSRGQNLVTNGAALLKNNFNFSAFTFDGIEAYGTAGSFRHTGQDTVAFSDEIMPIDPHLTYIMKLYAKTNPNVGQRYYFGVSAVDADNEPIQGLHHMYFAGTTTSLAQPLKYGDTEIYLTSAANWKNAAGTLTHYRMAILWNYKNAQGYVFPPETYSRWVSAYGIWDDGAVDYVNNKITLNQPWTLRNPNTADGTWPAGHPISNGTDGSNYKYIAACNWVIPETWMPYVGRIGGIDYSGTNISNMFPPGTAGVKLLFLLNRDAPGGAVNLANLSFGIDIGCTIDTSGNAVFPANVTSTGMIQPAGYYSADGTPGATGLFASQDGKTVTVKNGLITGIV